MKDSVSPSQRGDGLSGAPPTRPPGDEGAGVECFVTVPEGSTCELESYRRLHPPPMPRRDFLVWAAGISLGATVLFVGATVAQAVMPPPRSIEGKTKVGKLAVAKVSTLVVDTPVLVEYGDDALFVSKTAGDKIIVLDAACPHVRCKLFWNEQTKEYDCPCHASSFSITGKRLGGPAPRDMLGAIFVVENDQVVVSGIQG